MPQRGPQQPAQLTNERPEAADGRATSRVPRGSRQNAGRGPELPARWGDTVLESDELSVTFKAAINSELRLCSSLFLS